jgi:hypothetical protein
MVFDLLVGRFKAAPPVYLSQEEIEEWREKKQKSTQQRVLTVFTMWLEDHNLIKDDPHIVYRLQGFLQSITDPHPLAIPAKLILEAIERLVGTMVTLASHLFLTSSPRVMSLLLLRLLSRLRRPLSDGGSPGSLSTSLRRWIPKRSPDN